MEPASSNSLESFMWNAPQFLERNWQTLAVGGTVVGIMLIEGVPIQTVSAIAASSFAAQQLSIVDSHFNLLDGRFKAVVIAGSGVYAAMLTNAITGAMGVALRSGLLISGGVLARALWLNRDATADRASGIFQDTLKKTKEAAQSIGAKIGFSTLKDCIVQNTSAIGSGLSSKIKGAFSYIPGYKPTPQHLQAKVVNDFKRVSKSSEEIAGRGEQENEIFGALERLVNEEIPRLTGEALKLIETLYDETTGIPSAKECDTLEQLLVMTGQLKALTEEAERLLKSSVVKSHEVRALIDGIKSLKSSFEKAKGIEFCFETAKAAADIVKSGEEVR